MSTPYKLGEHGKLYYSATAATTVSYTLPTTTADNISNVKVNVSNDTPEYTTRANGGVKQYGNSLSDYTVTFDFKVPGAATDDAAYIVFQQAYILKTEIAAFVLNDLKTVIGAEGPAGNWIVSKFDDDQSNGKIGMKNVELKPSSFNSYYVVAS